MHSLVIQTNSELYAGISRQYAGTAWGGHVGNDNLLLTLSGQLGIRVGGKLCVFAARTLLYLPPCRQRDFFARSDWQGHWVHFDLKSCGNIRPGWDDDGDFLKALNLNQYDFRRIRYVFAQLCQVAQERRLGWRQLSYHLICEIILRGNMCAGNDLAPEHINLATKLLSRLEQPLGMNEIAARCGMSPTVFYAKFRESFGITPRRYREEEWLRQARYKLENTDKTLAQIASELGSSSAFYLSLRFKKKFGIAPSEYRRRVRNDLPPFPERPR